MKTELMLLRCLWFTCLWSGQVSLCDDGRLEILQE